MVSTMLNNQNIKKLMLNYKKNKIKVVKGHSL